MVAGALRQANSYFQEAYQFAHQIHVRQGSTFSQAVIGLANLHYEWNDLAAAEKYIQEGIEIVETGAFLDRIMLAYRVLLRWQTALGDFAGAHESIQRARQLAALYNAPDKVNARIDSLAASISLAEGDGVKTAVWAEQFAAHFDGQVSYEQEFELLTFCKILIAQKKYTTAIGWLNNLLDRAQKQARIRSIIRIRILLAQAHHLAGEQPKAIDYLDQALLLAEPEGFIRAFITPGEVIKHLLEEIQERGWDTAVASSSPAYIQKLLEAFNSKQSKTSPVKIGLEQFTAREREVLNALAEGLSYAAIGRKLTISQNTVRTHIKNIYSKLDVHNRTQVLLKAQETGLI
jgi:LuxR family maltose regulon positive regulatory protein